MLLGVLHQPAQCRPFFRRPASTGIRILVVDGPAAAAPAAGVATTSRVCSLPKRFSHRPPPLKHVPVRHADRLLSVFESSWHCLA